MPKAQKYRASKNAYVSPSQLILAGFESPFSQTLNPNNRWVILAGKIPWDILVDTYLFQLNNSETGADAINPRVAIGAMILKHMCNMSDRETVLQIQENMYMQYFIGYSSFSNEAPFDPSLFVEFRKRLGIHQINSINERILGLSVSNPTPEAEYTDDSDNTTGTSATEDSPQQKIVVPENEVPNKGTLITDATACPQDIAYPTDLNLLNDAREKSEEIIDVLYNPEYHNNRHGTTNIR
jgi:hypothetical protein